MEASDESHSLVSNNTLEVEQDPCLAERDSYGHQGAHPGNINNAANERPVSPMSSIRRHSARKSLDEKDKDLPNRLSWSRQFGKMAIFTLIASTVFIIAALSFTAFLWFSEDNNPTWHALMVRDWLTEATTILSEAIKQSLNVQIGVCGAMLAALTLERGELSLDHAASLTTMRNGLGASKVLNLSKIQFQSWRAAAGPILIPTLVILECLILGFGQVITIILTSDIGLHPVPGYPQSSQTPFGFTYRLPNGSVSREGLLLSRGSTWLRKAPFFPAFAEYSEPPIKQEGVSDTGLTLRAFLPYFSAQTRDATFSYNGRTTVLDSRVTCQVPSLKNEGVQSSDNGLLKFQGDVRPSTATPRLSNFTINDLAPGEISEDGLAFSCLAVAANNTSGYDQWKASLCQLGDGGEMETSWGGGLISEFADNLTVPDPRDQLAYGTAYLLLNITKGSAVEWMNVTEAINDNSDANVSISPSQYAVRHEWLDLIYAEGDLILSASLCYTAFNTADIPISISSKANRTEPNPSYDFDTSMYNFDSVREQLGQYSSSMSLEGRGLLQLNNQSWVANRSELPPVEPFIRDFANFQGPTGAGNKANWTATLIEYQTPSGDDAQNIDDPADILPYNIIPEISHIWLFQQIIQSGGSTAFALQSLITVLSSMAYYDQIGQFDNKALVDQASFVTSNTPQHHRGFVAVLVIVVVHMALVAIVMVMFLGTRYSMLGNDWQGLAQGVTPETEAYLALASRKTDDEVQKVMKGDRLKHLRVGIGQIDGTDKVGIIRYEKLRRRNPARAKELGCDEDGVVQRETTQVLRFSDDQIERTVSGYSTNE